MTRGSNTYGPFHHPEKLIPLFVTNAIDDLPLPLYGDGLQERDWLYVSDHAGAIDHVLRHGATGETYNVPGSAELTNREVVTALLERLGKPWSLVRSVPGPARATTAATPSTARSSPRSAGGTGRRSTTGSPRRSTGSSRTSRGGGRRRAATGTPTTSASTAPGSPPPPRPEPDAGRRHRRGRPARPGPRRRARGGAVHRPVRADRLDAGRSSTSTQPDAFAALLDRDRPEVVVHAAAWTDVDGCARDPELALARNGDGDRGPRRGCAARGIDLVVVSTNEVFDGRRTDGRGYAPDDPTDPINPYGASKLAGEDGARAA